jgi:hypothetical protein
MLSRQEMIDRLANDYDFEQVLYDNDMDYIDVIRLLVIRGRIDLDLYFTEDQIEMEED